MVTSSSCRHVGQFANMAVPLSDTDVERLDKEGDKICIFGFSRGAYTARALAGMIHKVGLLPEGNEQQVPFAYRMFMQDDEKGWRQSVLFVSVPLCLWCYTLIISYSRRNAHSLST